MNANSDEVVTLPHLYSTHHARLRGSCASHPARHVSLQTKLTLNVLPNLFFPFTLCKQATNWSCNHAEHLHSRSPTFPCA